MKDNGFESADIFFPGYGINKNYYKNLYKLNFCSKLYEEKFKALEKEKANALEMAT